MKYQIIGIAGNARSGKDTLGTNFVNLLNEYGIAAKTVSFAYALRNSLDDFLKEKIGISAFTQDQAEKDLIRPLLVCWGTDVMRKIKDDIWIDSIQEFMSDDCVNIITDLRFENELDWIKELDGLVVYLSRQDIGPANSYEEENNKIISAKANINFHWSSVNDEKLLSCLSNEALDLLLNEEKFELWKATCPLLTK